MHDLQTMIHCRSEVPASDLQVSTCVADVLARRAALPDPPRSLTISDAVALGVAQRYRGGTPSGRIFDRFCRIGSVWSGELIEAARAEQGFATPEEHAALHCLITWARSRSERSGALR